MKKQGGFIGLLILIIIALAFLYYFFDWSIFDVAASEKGIKTINYIKDILNFVWSYVKIPVMFIWQVVRDFFSDHLIAPQL